VNGEEPTGLPERVAVLHATKSSRTVIFVVSDSCGTMDSRVTAPKSDTGGLLGIQITILVTAVAWVILFSLGLYVGFVRSAPDMLGTNFVLLVSPFLIGWWYLRKRT